MSRPEGPLDSSAKDTPGGNVSGPPTTLSVGTPEDEFDIFLSFPAEEEARARDLRALLSPRLRVFFAHSDEHLGRDWDGAVDAGVRAARATVVVVSEHTAPAYYQRAEVIHALEKARDPSTGHRVIPIFVDGKPTWRSRIPWALRPKAGLALGAGMTLQGAAQKIEAALASPDTASAGAADDDRGARFPIEARVQRAFFALGGQLRAPALAAIGIVALLAFVRWFGGRVHLTRADFIGLPDEFTAPTETARLGGAIDALWDLGRYMLFGVFGGEWPERGVTLGAILCAAGAAALTTRRRLSLVAAALALAFVVLAPVSVVGSGGLAAHGVIVEKEAGAGCPDLKRGGEPGRVTWSRYVASEVCSWLGNEKPENGMRRAALAGMWGWLALAIVLFAVRAIAAAHRVGPRVDGRLGLAFVALGGCWLSIAAFHLRQLPRAIAFARFGVEAPRILSATGACPDVMARALSQPRCRVFEIAPGAGSPRAVVFDHDNCGDESGSWPPLQLLDDCHTTRGKTEIMRNRR